MRRQDAIAILVDDELPRLTADERSSVLADAWSIAPDDPAWPTLPADLRDELEREAYPPEDASPPRYDPLLRELLGHRYAGVLSSYLERRLAALGIATTVEGPVERLEPCPCCRYRTLDARGEYDICPVCFWEDDGVNDPGHDSGPNHMTLGEARASFARIGACDQASLAHVLPDGPARYPRDDP